MPVRWGVLFLAWACAQITITDNDLPSPGSTYVVSQSRPQPNIDFLTTGPNHSWDFSQLPSDTQATIAWKAPWEVPQYVFSCGNANLQALLLKLADSIPTFFGPSIRDLYAFLRKSSTSLSVHGVGGSVNGAPITQCYQDPDEVYMLPMTYGRQDSTTFWLRVSFPVPNWGNITIAQRGYRLHKVDGYGQIQTPYTQKACLRLRQDVYQKDTVYVNGVPVRRRDTSYVELLWVASGEGIPLLRVQGGWTGPDGATFAPTVIQFKNTSHPTALFSGGKEASITPNPTTGLLRVSPPSGYYAVFNLVGQLVAEGDVSPDGQIRLPTHLPEGVYFLRLTQNSQTTWHRFWLIR